MSHAQPILLSLVVPVLHEEGGIAPFLARVLALVLARATPALDEACRQVGPGTGFEVVFVDDGSTDATPAVLALARRADPRIEIVSLSRNFRQGRRPRGGPPPRARRRRHPD